MIDQLKQLTFRGIGEVGRCRIQNTLVIAGVPRAGTTWMLELLRHLRGYKALNEPLMYEEARNDYGFGWHKYIAPEEAAPQQRRYLETVLTGQMGISPAWFFQGETRPGQLLEHATQDKLVVKFCRLNRMLHWFVRQFEVRGLVLMVRHPCAVVASMLRHGAWDESDLHGTSRREQALHGGGLPDTLRGPFEPILSQLSSRIDVLATHWCLDHYVPLIQHAKEEGYPWVIAPYERLVTQGRAELRRITEALGVDMTTTMRAQLDEPSSSVEDRVYDEAHQQLSKWRRRLSDSQADRVLEIVDEVGLSSFYTDALEPNYAQMNECQHSHARW